jgi:hypothetical protein
MQAAMPESLHCGEVIGVIVEMVIIDMMDFATILNLPMNSRIHHAV